MVNWLIIININSFSGKTWLWLDNLREKFCQNFSLIIKAISCKARPFNMPIQTLAKLLWKLLSVLLILGKGLIVEKECSVRFLAKSLG